MLNRRPKSTIRKSTPLNMNSQIASNIPIQSPIQTNSVNYLENIVNPNIDNQVRMSNVRNPLFADDTMLSEGALNEINRLNQTQIPMTQSAINEDEDIGGGGIGIGEAIAQSVAMLGAGVRGGDVGQVGRMFDLNRQEAFRQGQYQKQKAEQKQKIKEQENTAKQYVDPNSEISIQERAKARELYGDAISDKFSYADLQNRFVREAIEKKYNAIQEQKNLEEQKGLQSRLDDPNSPESIKLRNDLNLLRINVPKGLSANQMKEYYPRLLELSKPQPMIGGGGVRGGGVRQEKPEKESKEQVEANKITAQANSLKNKLIEYREAVKQIPNPIFGGAAQKARAESLKSDILLMIKDVNKTGALDIGSVEVIEQKIGTPDYTRNEVIDSRINQTLKSLNDDVESKMKGANTINKFYTPYESNEIDFNKE